jgi:hypothetical protein
MHVRRFGAENFADRSNRVFTETVIESPQAFSRVLDFVRNTV